MKKAAKREKDLTIALGDLGIDGIPVWCVKQAG